MTKLVLSGLLIVLAISTWLSAQDSNVDWTFGDIQTTVTRLELSGGTKADEINALTSISSALNQIRSRYLQAYGEDADNIDSIRKHLSAEYSASMAADLATLNGLPSDHEKRLAILNYVREDVSTKAAFLSRTLGATGTFPSIISVTIQTVSASGQNVSGLWIRCNPARYGITKNPLFVFNSATTPTTAPLPPANLVCWVQDSSEIVVLKVSIQTGMGGKLTETIRLSLP
jgi:hypothetical protein